MQHISPVWRAMFSGQWIYSGFQEMRLPDDDIESMLLILRIAHIRFDELSPEGEMDLEDL
jgi:hypothetical protein